MTRFRALWLRKIVFFTIYSSVFHVLFSKISPTSSPSGNGVAKVSVRWMTNAEPCPMAYAGTDLPVQLRKKFNPHGYDWVCVRLYSLGETP